MYQCRIEEALCSPWGSKAHRQSKMMMQNCKVVRNSFGTNFVAFAQTKCNVPVASCWLSSFVFLCADLKHCADTQMALETQI